MNKKETDNRTYWLEMIIQYPLPLISKSIDGKIREYKQRFELLKAKQEAEANECAERIKQIIEETRDVNERVKLVQNSTGCYCKFIQTQKGKVGTVFKRSKELLIQLSARDKNARAWVAVIQREL